MAEEELIAQRRIRRRWIWLGRVVSPTLAVLVYLGLRAHWPEQQLSREACVTAAIGTLIAGLWLTEAMPLPVTALLPMVLFPLLGVLPLRDAAAPYASPPIFLFMGGFMLAIAMERWGLHRRIALHIVRYAGRSALGLLAGFMLASAFLSMWISNTATTVMMVPIVLSVVSWAEEKLGREEADRFGSSLLLGVAYAASIGGSITLVGTPPNVLLAAFARDELNVAVPFGQWMVLAAPIGVVLLAVLFGYMAAGMPRGVNRLAEHTGLLVQRELAALGPPTRAERIVLAVFAVTVAAWLSHDWLERIAPLVRFIPWLPRLSDEMIAILAAVALFVIPVDFETNEFALDWETAVRLPWGVLLIFGGGLSLARAVASSGLDRWIAGQVAGWGHLPGWALAAAITAVVIFATELASNTATASAFLPILAAAAKGMGIPPMVLLVPATMAASYAFMLPAGTPPNAIVFGTGRITIQRMARTGLLMNLVAIATLTLFATYWLPLLGLTGR